MGWNGCFQHYVEGQRSISKAFYLLPTAAKGCAKDFVVNDVHICIEAGASLALLAW